VFIGPEGLLGCAVAGLLAGVLSALLTVGVYAAEDAFQRLPIHWMWWPSIGGLVVGLGGLIFPQALGVGYDTIGALLQGDVSRSVIVGILAVKSIIWIVSLGSGTSGGVLAPLLMMGGALGGVEAMFLPAEGAGFWPVVSMAAILGGTMRSPFTGIVFALELTHDINLLLPLMVAAFLAHAFTTLTLKRSILTEKVARRGFHLSREYAVDPLEILFVSDVMRTNVVALPERPELHTISARHGQLLYPVVTEDGMLAGVVRRAQLAEFCASEDVLDRNPVVCYPKEPLRVVVNRMAETGRTRLPVVENRNSRKLVGMVSLNDLFQARVRNLDEEHRRERVLRMRFPILSR
jgi:CBS domain-containing protein